MPTYDPTVAIIAGQILGGTPASLMRDLDGAVSDANRRQARWAVGMARAIVAETIRTEPPCTHRYLNTSWCVDCGAEKAEPREGDPT